MNTDNKIHSIKEFKASKKFQCLEPEFRILNPSPDSIISQARGCLEDCIDQVLYSLQEGKKTDSIRKQIKRHIHTVDKHDLDTEDREYVAYYFHKLGELAEVNVSSVVNVWLYGFPLGHIASLIKKG